MAVVSSFPLLGLPHKNLKNVSHSMGTGELIVFSLLSKRAKSFIKEFRTSNDWNVCLTVTDSLYCEMAHPRTRCALCTFKNGKVVLGYWLRDEEIKFDVPQFDDESWLNHLRYILNLSRIEVLSYTLSDNDFDEERFQMIKESLSEVKISNISIEFNTKTQHIYIIVSTFPTNGYFDLEQEVQQTLSSSQLLALHPLLSQEYSSFNSAFKLSLNELLLTSCTFLKVTNTPLTDKEINVFLKHWMAGLKPKLKYLCIENEEHDFDQSTILEGIHYEFAPIDRKFKMIYEQAEVGGIDIFLAQGIKATMVFDDDVFAIQVAVHDSEYITIL